MSEPDRIISRASAELYERSFVPGLFDLWPDHVLEDAHVSRGDRVLDVACGTGILARHAIRRGALATGLDLNPAMLAVARRVAPTIDWHHGRAEELPFADSTFDAVVSQFGMMFFADREKAVREMVRVVRPGGHIAVAVWAGFDVNPAWEVLGRLLGDLFGAEAAHENDVPFKLRDPADLAAPFEAAGLVPTIRTVQADARFPSLEEWLRTEVRSWTLDGRIDETGFARLVAGAREALADVIRPDGSIVAAMGSHVASVRID